MSSSSAGRPPRQPSVFDVPEIERPSRSQEIIVDVPEHVRAESRAALMDWLAQPPGLSYWTQESIGRSVPATGSPSLSITEDGFIFHRPGKESVHLDVDTLETLVELAEIFKKPETRKRLIEEISRERDRFEALDTEEDDENRSLQDRLQGRWTGPGIRNRR